MYATRPRRVKKIRFDYSTYLFFWLLAANDAGGARRLGFVFVVQLLYVPARYTVVLYAPIRSCSFLTLCFSFFYPKSQ